MLSLSFSAGGPAPPSERAQTRVSKPRAAGAARPHPRFNNPEPPSSLS
jgi:hypothetical protein